MVSRASQWTGFYMVTASVMKELSKRVYKIRYYLPIPVTPVKEFFFWDITQQYHEKSLYILAVVIVLVNIFQLYIAVSLSFLCNIFHDTY